MPRSRHWCFMPGTTTCWGRSCEPRTAAKGHEGAHIRGPWGESPLGGAARSAWGADMMRADASLVAAFTEVLQRCGVQEGDACAVLSETRSRAMLVQAAELALGALKAR